MAHEHKVIDKDTHFKVDGITMAISCAGTVKALKRGDHKAERFTFEMPRYIEGHDMSLCNKVEVHYNNIKHDSATRETTTNKSFDDVEDFGISPESDETVTWSWLIQGDATQLDGTLNFCIRFACLTGDEIDYQKFTETYVGVSVGETIWNTEAMAKAYADVLEKWRQELLIAIENGGAVKTVNGVEPDENGNVQIDTASSWNDLKDKPFYTETEIVELLPVQKIDNSALDEEIGILCPYIPVVEGRTYIVHYEGADYECTAKAVELSGVPFLCLTDGEIIDFEAGNVTSEKFMILLVYEDMAAEGVGGILMPVHRDVDILAEYTVGIAEKVETVHKLDAKYLPADYDFVVKSICNADDTHVAELVSSDYATAKEKIKKGVPVNCLYIMRFELQEPELLRVNEMSVLNPVSLNTIFYNDGSTSELMRIEGYDGFVVDILPDNTIAE